MTKIAADNWDASKLFAMNYALITSIKKSEKTTS